VHANTAIGEGDNNIEHCKKKYNNDGNYNDNGVEDDKVYDAYGVEDDKDDDEYEAREELFEVVENQANPPNSVDFTRDERINLPMYFNYPQFSVDHVQNFVLHSPVSGWEVMFNKTFNTASITCEDEKTYHKAFTYCFMTSASCKKSQTCKSRY
jgi:hypothetical protein